MHTSIQVNATSSTSNVAASSAQDLFPAILAAIQCPDPVTKCALTQTLWQAWQHGELDWQSGQAAPVLPFAPPGRPDRPMLVPPAQVKQRSVGSIEGRAAMLHAIAHIEFNAINLALDAVYRFRGFPADYYGAWLGVAQEEAEHFTLVRQHLQTLGYDYGDFPAHDGLWEMAGRTADDALARMALDPRLFEARGLDATPPLINKFISVADHEAVRILRIILEEEVGHVALGDKWFRYLCAARGLEPMATYQHLLQTYAAPRLRPPFNVEARLAAGFTEEELAALAAA